MRRDRQGALRPSPGLIGVICTSLTACAGWGSGSAWIEQPLTAEEEPAFPRGTSASTGGRRAARASRTLGAASRPSDAPSFEGGEPVVSGQSGGRVLGTFRNTYYDFPREIPGGPTVALKGATCAPIAEVPRSFFEAVCVQGSGALARGGTVSFAKRDCACAEVCPRTGQRICFEALDARSYPWGRGASGKAIAPLRTIAADTTVLPMGTAVYIPELEGAPGANGAPSDGCFVVEDRGLKVQGEHVDIFTGDPAQTRVLNERVPSNRGVTIIVDAPRCAHLSSR